MASTLTAQKLYDWREETAVISGTELAQLFQELTGEPSPVGRTPISLSKLIDLAADGYDDARLALAALG